MPRAKTKTAASGSARKFRPALSPEARDQQLISLAMDCAEEQIRSGTASSQVITHFLKLGSAEYEKKIERLEEENKLLRAKTESLQSQSRIEELYANAIKAMSKYNGSGAYEDEEDYDDEY